MQYKFILQNWWLEQGSLYNPNPNNALLFTGNPSKSPLICIVWSPQDVETEGRRPKKNRIARDRAFHSFAETVYGLIGLRVIPPKRHRFMKGRDICLEYIFGIIYYFRTIYIYDFLVCRVYIYIFIYILSFILIYIYPGYGLGNSTTRFVWLCAEDASTKRPVEATLEPP